MSDLFQREQQLLVDVLDHVKDLKQKQQPVDDVLETLASEYGILLEQTKKILRISDRASLGLLNDHLNLNKQIDALENELLQSQISVMLSQIQPHFLFNSLLAIRELCLIEPETASEAVDEFSAYLRANLDSLNIKIPIPFDKELRHVKTYLSLEKKRFGDKVNIVYDINTTDFSIPVLTLQPIVENAVRHGITKREDGGTVVIKTEEKDDEIIITVTDDGVGFDSECEQESNRHVGIRNVRSRLAAMFCGSLCVQSKPGVGTTAVIRILKEACE